MQTIKKVNKYTNKEPKWI